MVKLRTLPPAQSDIQSMRHFYSRIRALPQYDHCHEVYAKGAKVSIIEEDIVRDRLETPERRWANVALRRLALCHVLDPEEIRQTSISLPSALRDDRVIEELEIFGRLSELERTGAPTSAYASVLNNGQPPLALLVKLADYAVTHQNEAQLVNFVSSGRRSLIRQYASVDEAQMVMKMDAKAGERIYAPIAELFGYPELAGDIFQHAFRINHPEIHEHVLGTMQDETMMARLARTQLLVSELAKVINNVLKACGFEAEVTVRKYKHDGKKMSKTLRHLTRDYEKSADRLHMSLDEYVRQNVRSFDFERFNDWVAVRAVVSMFKGRDVDALPYDEQKRVLELGLSCINNALDMLRLAYKDLVGELIAKPQFWNKENGYRSHHIDVHSVRKDSVIGLLPFEVQLRTAEWHEVAEHGKAGHYYYIGGEPAFVDMIVRTYHDILFPKGAAVASDKPAQVRAGGSTSS